MISCFSGQAVTTFESIRHLLLPTPSGPGMPTSNPVQSSSRASRSGSAHPYPGRVDPYYDDMHPSRYHPPPHGYEAGPPPRDWRPWDERSRSRPVYQSISPRGRRYNDDRGDYYHREGDHFDRMPSRYEHEYRGDYVRKEHAQDFPSRGYDDYHRSMKPRDHHEPYHAHMTPPGRMVARRSRSISPRLPVPSSRARAPEFDPKLESRPRDHRGLSRGRSPIKSPGPKDWSTRKYRDHSSHTSPNVYSRKDDERRVELRDGKSLSGSPRSGSVSMRTKVVHNSPEPRGAGNWPSGHSSVRARQDSELLAAWGVPEYERSRSETPTRDENIAMIGEVIIKQPNVLPSKKERREEREGDLKKKKAKHSHKNAEYDECSPDRASLHRKSPFVDKKKKQKEKQLKETTQEQKYKTKHKQSESDEEKVAKKSKLLSTKEEKRRKHPRTSELKQQHQDKGHGRASALIKREYSPSSVDESIELKNREKNFKGDSSALHKAEEKHKKGQERFLKGESLISEGTSTYKKRKRSQTMEKYSGKYYDVVCFMLVLFFMLTQACR